MNNGMKGNTTPPTLSKVFDFNSNLPKEYERKKWLATTSGLDETGEETGCSTQWLPIIKPKTPVVASMLIRSTTAPFIHCINSFLPMKIQEFFVICVLYLSPVGLLVAVSQWYFEQMKCTKALNGLVWHTESVYARSSIHYSLPHYKTLHISPPL